MPVTRGAGNNGARNRLSPDPPPEAQKAPFPVLAVLVSVLAGVMMALLLKLPATTVAGLLPFCSS